MKAILACATLTLVSCTAGCATPRNSARQRRLLLETDRAWAAAASAGDINRIISYWADDATNFFPGAPVARGKEALGELLRRNRSQPGFSLRWTPMYATVAQSGDLGYTHGSFQLSRTNAKGQSVTKSGHYVCIWEKRADSRKWKCVVESTIFGP